MHRWWAADAGSLPLAMLLTMVGSGLAAMIAPLVLNQLEATRTEMRRTHAVNAAHSGLNAALGRIRAARTADGTGLPARLPCTGTNRIRGSVGGGTGRYEVDVAYLSVSPLGRSEAWVQQRRLACVEGVGPARPPRYAVAFSVGVDQQDGRSVAVRGTYRLRSTLNPNIPGGLVRVYRTDRCLDAGSATPGAGTAMAVQQCAPDAARQAFAYNSQLNLVLVSSSTDTYPRGLCLDAPAVVNVAVRLQPCAVPAVPSQQWSYNDWRNFEGTTDGVALNGFCLNVDGAALVVGQQSLDAQGRRTEDTRCRRDTLDVVQSFAPDPAVGAGAATARTEQLVNFEEFGRCLDVDKGDVTLPLIVYPCKQAPSAAAIHWNQRWTLPGGGAGTGPITVARAGEQNRRYCLSAPQGNGAKLLVRVEPCPEGVPPARLTWTAHRRTNTFDGSYVITDHLGRCLASSPEHVRHVDLTNYAIVDGCDGSRIQKWNVDPGSWLPAFTDVAEK